MWYIKKNGQALNLDAMVDLVVFPANKEGNFELIATAVNSKRFTVESFRHFDQGVSFLKNLLDSADVLVESSVFEENFNEMV